MANPRPIFEDDEAADAEARADFTTGRVISNDAMIAWLRSWGTPDELPPPAISGDCD